MKNILTNPSAKRRDHRELEIIQLASFVAKNPSASIADIMVGADAIGPSCRTSYYLYLDEAIKNGWLTKTGATSGTRYFSTPQFLHHVAMADLAVPVGKRAKVGYKEEFLGEYVPNQSAYLTQSQKEQLHRACPRGSFDAGDPKVAGAIRRFMADLSFNSSAFEGVQAKYADTISFLEGNITSQNISPIDATILRNHYSCIRFIIDNTHHPRQPSDIAVSEYDCRNIHAQLSDGLLNDRRAQGRLRYEHVEIRDSCYIPPEQPDIISKEFSSIMKKASEIVDPFEQSLFLLVHIPYLQPFEDCNKRTSRLVCNVPLLANGILPVSWSEVAPRDYADALLCIYEKNSVYGLTGVFVESCMRSFERFELAGKERQPDRLEITYAKQIATAVKNRIVFGDDTVQADVDPLHLVKFEAIVGEILDAIKDNEMVAAPYRIDRAALAQWRNNNQEKPNDSPK